MKKHRRQRSADDNVPILCFRHANELGNVIKLMIGVGPGCQSISQAIGIIILSHKQKVVGSYIRKLMFFYNMCIWRRNSEVEGHVKVTW